MQPLRVTMGPGRALSPEERRDASVFISRLYPMGHRGRLGPRRSAAWSGWVAVPRDVLCFVIHPGRRSASVRRGS